MTEQQPPKRRRPITKRAARYGSLLRGWDWRTTKERLDRMEADRAQLGIGKTEYLERAIDAYLNRKV